MPSPLRHATALHEFLFSALDERDCEPISIQCAVYPLASMQRALWWSVHAIGGIVSIMVSAAPAECVQRAFTLKVPCFVDHKVLALRRLAASSHHAPAGLRLTGRYG